MTTRFVQTYLNEEDHKKLRIISIQQDKTMLKLIQDIIVTWLAQQQPYKEETDNGEEKNGQEN